MLLDVREKKAIKKTKAKIELLRFIFSIRLSFKEWERNNCVEWKRTMFINFQMNKVLKSNHFSLMTA